MPLQLVFIYCCAGRQTDRQTDRQAGDRMMRAIEGNMPPKGGIIPTQRMIRNFEFPLRIIYVKQSEESLSSLVFSCGQGNRKGTRPTISLALRFNASITFRYFVLSIPFTERQIRGQTACETQNFCTLYRIIPARSLRNIK